MNPQEDHPASGLSLGWIFRHNRSALALALFWSVLAEAAGFLIIAAVCLAVFWAIDGTLANQGLAKALWLAAWLVGAIFIKGLGSYLSTASAHKVAFEFLRQTRWRLAKHLARLPLGAFDQHNTGQMKKILWEDVERLEAFIAHNIPDVLASAINLALAAGLLIALDWRIGLAAVGVALGCVAAYGMATGRHRDLYRRWCLANEDLNAAMIEYIQGMPAIKAFNRPSHFFAALGRAIDLCASLEKELAAKWYWPMTVFFGGLTGLPCSHLAFGRLAAPARGRFRRCVDLADAAWPALWLRFFVPAFLWGQHGAKRSRHQPHKRPVGQPGHARAGPWP